MKRIDKSLYREEFNVYSRDYLRDHLNRQGKFVPKLAEKKTYTDKFSANRYKKTAHPENSRFQGWRDILLAETRGRCCYCMRHLDKDLMSFEHIVPESCEETEYNYYAEKSLDIREYVELGSKFDEEAENGPIDIDSLTKFPHFIAHSNLFPACQNTGHGCSCNNHRGKERILPLMLMSDIEEKVNYTEEGEMELLYDEDEDYMVSNTLTHLDINMGILKTIRKLWYKFSQKQIVIPRNFAVDFGEMDTLMRLALDLSPTDIIPLEYQDLTREEKDGSLKNFSLFLKYNWFYTYYSNKYPLQ